MNSFIKNIILVFLGIIILSSCGADQIEKQESHTDTIALSDSNEEIDSTEFYLFFLDKITTNFENQRDDDAVTYRYGQYGLPVTAQVYRGATETSRGHFVLKREYDYNLNDSTETVRHYNEYGGLLSTEVRKFNSEGKLEWKKETYMDEAKTNFYYKYNSYGTLIRRVDVDGNFGDTIEIIDY